MCIRDRIFTHNEEYISLTVWAIRIYTAGIIPLALQYVVVDGFTGMGVASVAIFLSMFRKVLYLGGVFVLPVLFGVCLLYTSSGVDAAVLYLSCEDGGAQKVFSIYNNWGMAGLLAASAVYSAVIGENYRLAGLMTVFSYGLGAVLVFGLQDVKGQESRTHTVLTEGPYLWKRLFFNKNIFFLLLASALLSETHQTITVFLNQQMCIRDRVCTETAIWMDANSSGHFHVDGSQYISKSDDSGAAQRDSG